MRFSCLELGDPHVIFPTEHLLMEHLSLLLTAAHSRWRWYQHICTVKSSRGRVFVTQSLSCDGRGLLCQGWWRNTAGRPTFPSQIWRSFPWFNTGPAFVIPFPTCGLHSKGCESLHLPLYTTQGTHWRCSAWPWQRSSSQVGPAAALPNMSTAKFKCNHRRSWPMSVLAPSPFSRSSLVHGAWLSLCRRSGQS